MLGALLAIAALAGGGAALGSVHQRAASSAPKPRAHSGVWYCPHGGGSGWHVDLAVTNPGSHPVSIRVTTSGEKGTVATQGMTVSPRAVVHVPVKADTRGAASDVEYFGGWVGVSWAAQAGGAESGIAAEPCTRSLGRTWFMPDGTTLRGQDAWVVVMNPTAVPAIFSLSLHTPDETILPGDWSDFVLEARRSAAFFLNSKKLATEPVAAEIEVRSGRVAAASLGASAGGGIRAALGITAPEHDAFLPGSPGSSRSELVVVDAGTRRATYAGKVETSRGAQAIGQLRGETLQPGQARTYDLTTQPDAAIDVALTSGDGLALARRSLGPSSDAGSSAGAAAGPAWVLAAGTFSRDDGWRLDLADPGPDVALVEVWLVSPRGAAQKPSVRTLRVGAGQTRSVGSDFTAQAPLGSVVVVALRGVVVPLAASSTRGGGYATSVGVPIPGRWVPSRPS